MKKLFLRFSLCCIGIMIMSVCVMSQTVSVNLGSTQQVIRGFGGMNFPRWIGDLTSSEADEAFGNGSGQIGLSILRISVPPNQSDWSGEVPTAQRAESHGAIVFATPWSPPASMKSNGSTIGGSLNPSSYGAYANYLTDFANYMSSNGAALYAISVQNEPDWTPSYESCGWTASQMKTFLDNNASVIPVKVIAPETVHPNSSWYNTLSSSPQLDIYADHLYGGSPTSFGKEHWMTEHYTNSNISGNQWPDALDAGIEVANCMSHNYSAYVWWYIRRSYGLIDENGNVTKRGYVMSQFAKFVRPGYYRVDATYSPTSNVYVTAYKNSSTLVIVAINRNSSSQNVTFNFSGNTASNFTKYQTTSSSNVSNAGTISGGSSMTNTLAGYSISTFVGTIGSGGGGSCTPTAITPYIQINGGSWQQISSVTVNSGSTVKFGPQPTTGGSWSWTGCGTSGTSREQTFTANNSCTATATYTNSSGCQSTQDFNVTVSGSSSYPIVVRARGTSGSENIRLTVGGTQVASWTLSTSMASYSASTSLSGVINVEFTNDNGTSRDVQVDYITENGTTYQAEDQATNTGVWQNSSCGGSYSEWLHCNGYISFPAYKRAEESLITNNDQEVNIYPNPARDLLTVSLSSIFKNGGQISIYNSMGTLVQVMKIKGLKNNIDLTKFPAGMYIMRVSNEKYMINKKFIKQ